MQVPIRAVTGALDATIGHAWRGNRERWISDSAAEAYGQAMGYRNMGRELKKALVDEEYALKQRMADDFYRGKGAAIKGRQWMLDKPWFSDAFLDHLQEAVGPIIRYPFRGLGMGDILVRRPTEHGMIYTIAAREAHKKGFRTGSKKFHEHIAKRVTEPDEDWIRMMKDEGNLTLFQREHPGFFASIGELRSKHPWTKLFIPFYRTLNDLVHQGIELSPLSPFRPGFWRAVKSSRGEAMDEIGKMVTGSSVMYAIYSNFGEDRITGRAPTTPAERDQFYREGKQPYSVRVGDTWYPYHRFAPYSYWFMGASALHEASNMEDEDKISELVADSAFQMARAVADQSFVVGISSTLDAITDPNAFDRWLKNTLVGATMPNISAATARAIDPKIRDLDTLTDYYMARLPGASQSLPLRYNAFGEPLERQGNFWLRFFSPVIPSKVQMDAVTREMSDIGYNLGPPGKEAFGFEVEDEDYREFQRVSGNLIYDLLSAVVIHPEFAETTPSNKERIFDGVVGNVRRRVRESMFIEQRMKNELADSIAQQEGLTREEARKEAEGRFQEDYWQEQYNAIIQSWEPDLSELEF